MIIGIKDVLFNIRWFFVPYLLILIACLLIKINFTRADIFFAVNSHNYPWADAIAPYVTDIGNAWATVAIIFILLFLNFRKTLIMTVVYILVPGLVTQSLKFIFNAPRPKLYFHDQLSRIHFVKGVDILARHSFPSGHTISAFSTAIVIAYFCKNKLWGLPLLLVAISVGYSRMYLSQHFFEDVTAGSVIGTISTVCLITWLDSRKFIHSEKWNRGLIKK
jgi:membrane-associated phospholipid phosphatase